MPYRQRMSKGRPVTYFMSTSGTRRSDQREVWEQVDRMAEEAGVHSSTAAMHDVYGATRETLEQRLAHFPLLEGQIGFVALLHGSVAGVEALSDAAAYARSHARLLGSYIADAGADHGHLSGTAADARAFLTAAGHSSFEAYPGVGYGEELRATSAEISGQHWSTRDVLSTSRSRQVWRPAAKAGFGCRTPARIG